MGKVLHLLWSADIGGIEKLCFMIGENEKENHMFYVVNQKGRLFEKMKEEKIDVQFLGLGNKDIIMACRKFVLMYKRKMFESLIVHHDAPMLWIVAIWLKIRYAKCRVYLYAHCDYNYFIKNSQLRKMLFSMAAQKSDGVIAISKFVKSSIVRKSKIEEDHICVIYNGVDLEKFQCIQQKKFDGTLRIIFVGRLIKEKGVQLLLNSLGLIDGKISFQCTIVGEGEYLNELQQILKDNKIKSKVEFIGNKYNVIPYLREANLFVHPAICEEGFGLALVEAMAAGLACVAFPKGAIPEIIEDYKNGFLVTEARADLLATKLLEIYEIMGTERYKLICTNAEKKAQRFSKVNYLVELKKLIGQGN